MRAPRSVWAVSVRLHTQVVRKALLGLLVGMALLAGCGGQVQEPPAATGTARATSTARATNTALPTSTAAPLREATAEPERLVSRHTDSAPVIDGQIEAAWDAAEPLRVPLTWGVEGAEHALDVELRSLYDDQALYLLARWPGERPIDEGDTVYNQFTVHWRIPEPDAVRLDCNIACHTVFADGQGRVAYANAETIPYGGSEALQVAGDWQAGDSGAGTWTLEWSRPLVNGNPFDLQLGDRDRAYAFRVKVFARIEGRPDPISKLQQLVFSP
jgi:hypothetical protein